MRRLVCCLAVLCLLLSGCGPLGEGTYYWEASHPVEQAAAQPEQDTAVCLN